MSSKGWIGVDFDGTLATYDGWQGHTVFGDPVPLMVARVKRWLAEGKTVKVFTARVGFGNPAVEVMEAREAIEQWCHEHIGQRLEVVCCKDFAMIELWDDRAVAVQKNTGEFKSWE